MNRNTELKGVSRSVLTVLLALLLLCGCVTGALALADSEDEAALQTEQVEQIEQINETADTAPAEEAETEEALADEDTAPEKDAEPEETEGAEAPEEGSPEETEEIEEALDEELEEELEDPDALGEEPYEAAVGEDKYETLSEAIAAAGSSGTVTLLKDITYTKNTGWNISGQSITLDLNGKTISATAPDKVHSYIFQVGSGGALTVKDSAGGGGMTMHWNSPDPGFGAGNYVIYNNGGSLTVNSGRLTNTTTGSGAYYVITNWSGTTTINGGSLNCTAGSSSAVRLFCGGGTSKVVVNGGSIAGGYFGVQVQNNGANPGELIIHGGTISTTDDYYDMAVYAAGANTKVTIDGGDFKDDVAFSDSIPASSLSVTDGLFEGPYGCYSYDDNCLFIEGGTFTGDNAEYSYYFKTDDSGWGYLPDGTFVIGDFETVEVEATLENAEKFEDEDDPDFTFTLSDSKANGFVTAEFEREAGDKPGEYDITFKDITGGFNDDETIYYAPYYDDAEKATLTIKEAYFKRSLSGKDSTARVSIEGDNINHSAEIVVSAVTAADKATLKSKAKTGQELVIAQDISLKVDGTSVPFEGTIDVTLEPGTKYNGYDITVWHLKSDGSAESWDKKVENGKVTVTVDSLSPFGGLLVPPAGSGGGAGGTGGGTGGTGGAKTGDNSDRVWAVLSASFLLSAAYVAYLLIKNRGLSFLLPAKEAPETLE